jgi:hypothetical protein
MAAYGPGLVMCEKQRGAISRRRIDVPAAAFLPR